MSSNIKHEVIDTHIHLQALKNMHLLKWQKGHPLHRELGLSTYLTETQSPTIEVKGVIVVEFDPSVDITQGIQGCTNALEEYLYIIRLIRGEVEKGCNEGSIIKAVIPWAPLPLGRQGLQAYIEQMKNLSPESKDFEFVKGFRYLLQDKQPGTMMQPEFIESLKFLEENNFIFEWGIDLRSGGPKQFEETIEVFSKVPNLKYIINHLTKPNLRIPVNQITQSTEFLEWKRYMSQIFELSPKSYMKLSGVFSELPFDALDDINKCVDIIYPWFKVCWDLWGADRTIWASNWPVCALYTKNLVTRWFSITEKLFDRINLSQASRNNVYRSNYLKAYNIEDYRKS